MPKEMPQDMCLRLQQQADWTPLKRFANVSLWCALLALSWPVSLPLDFDPRQTPSGSAHMLARQGGRAALTRLEGGGEGMLITLVFKSWASVFAPPLPSSRPRALAPFQALFQTYFQSSLPSFSPHFKWPIFQRVHPHPRGHPRTRVPP